MCPALLCAVGQFVQRAPLRLFNDYRYLPIANLTTNQAVGSSNLSGRAIFQSVSGPSWAADLLCRQHVDKRVAQHRFMTSFPAQVPNPGLPDELDGVSVHELIH